MPFYDFTCEECERQAIDVFIPLRNYTEYLDLKCPDCGHGRFRLVVRPPAVEDWGNGRWFEHLGPTGKTFYSKKAYKEHLRREGLIEWSPKTGMPGSGV